MTTKETDNEICSVNSIAESGPSHKIIKNANSRKLVIFFSGTNKSNGRFDFWKSSSTLPYNILLINNDINGWYQNDIPDFSSSVSDTVEKIKACAEQLSCNEIIMVGVSMGGYAAILFGSLLDTRVMAFSFDTVLRHPLSRSAKRMPKKVKEVYKYLRPIVQNSKSRIVAISGEMDYSDLISLSRISDLPNVKAYCLRGVTHGTGRYLDKHYGISEIINGFIEKDSLPVIKEFSNLCHDKIQSKLIFQAHQAYQKKDYTQAISIANKAIKINPLSEPAIYISGLANLELKKYSKAAEQFAFTVGMSPHFTTAKFNLAKSLRLAKEYDQAIHHFLEYIDAMPQSAGAHHNLSLIFEKKGFETNCITMAKKAFELSPDHEVYRARYNSLIS